MYIIINVIIIQEGRDLLSQIGKNVSVSLAKTNTSAVRTTEIKAYHCPEANVGDGLAEYQLLEEDLLI